MQVFLILALVVALLAVVFALQNATSIAVSFLFWKFTGSLALVLIISLAAGALITLLALSPGLLRGRISMRKLRKQLDEVEGDLKAHKQSLEEANLKLEEQLASLHPAEPGSKPPDQTGTNV
jgi:putative membrane protein